MILFNNVALKILGMTLPPNVLANFLLMGGAEDPAQQNVAWYLAVAQKCAEKPTERGMSTPVCVSPPPNIGTLNNS